MSTPTPGRGCEVELIALCSQKTDPIPVCYTLNGVSQTIYAVLKHPHKGAPTVGFMLPDFTSFDATTGGTFAVGACPLAVVDRFVNPVHWCEPGVRIPGGARDIKGDWQWGNFGSPQAWRFYTAEGGNGTYFQADAINDWYVNSTTPTYTLTVPAPNLPGVNQTIVITRSEINSVAFQANNSIEIIGLNAPTNINPNVDPNLDRDSVSWRVIDQIADTNTPATCKEGKALYTRDAQNQVKLDGVITLDGLPVVVDPLILKEGACALGDCKQTKTLTGAASFIGAAVINKATLMANQPVGAALVGVNIQVRQGQPTIAGSVPLPVGAQAVVAPAIYQQTWSSSDLLGLDDFTYTLANGDAVDVFYTITI